MAKEWGYASHNGEWNQGNHYSVALALYMCTGKRRYRSRS